MILYVKSDIDPVFDNWVWYDSEDKEKRKSFSFRGVKQVSDLFNDACDTEKKIKFKFIKSKTGLLINFDDVKNSYNKYRLYLNEKVYCEFNLQGVYNVNGISEYDCSYFVLRFSLDCRKLKYHNKGYYNEFIEPVFLGIIDVDKDSFMGMPFRTELSNDKKKRYFFSLLNNESFRNNRLYYTCSKKINNKLIEINWVKKILFSYWAVSVSIESNFSNRRDNLKLIA